jgi:hypothetical protein
MTEQWKIAAGTDRQYEVSDLGSVRRRDGLMLTPSVPRNAREYPAVMLRYSGQRRRVAVHRLVALNFVGLPPFAGAQVRHLDGNHLNARADNLAWGSAKDNADDREQHGRTAKGPRPNRRGKGCGEANANYRVTPEMKARACALVDRGMTQRQAAEAVGITQKSVWAALRARAAQ